MHFCGSVTLRVRHPAHINPNCWSHLQDLACRDQEQLPSIIRQYRLFRCVPSGPIPHHNFATKDATSQHRQRPNSKERGKSTPSAQRGNLNTPSKDTTTSKNQPIPPAIPELLSKYFLPSPLPGSVSHVLYAQIGEKNTARAPVLIHTKEQLRSRYLSNRCPLRCGPLGHRRDSLGRHLPPADPPDRHWRNHPRGLTLPRPHTLGCWDDSAGLHHGWTEIAAAAVSRLETRAGFMCRHDRDN